MEVGGNRARLLDSGGGGSALLLVHGLGASAERWAPVVPLLSGRFRLVAPDLVGFGRSDKPHADYTPGFLAGFAAGLLDELGIGRAHVAGSSMGGQVAAELAASRPEMVDRLVLVSPSGMMGRSTPALDSYVMAALYPSEEAAAEAFRAMSGTGEADGGLARAFAERMRLPNAKMAFMSALLGIRDAGDIAGRLAAVAAPTLVVWGALDPVIPAAHAGDFASAIPDCRVHVMPGSGHTPFADSPAEFAAAVGPFLEGR